MHLLIVASTPYEFYELKSFYESNQIEFYEKNLILDFVVCGVGLVPTVFHLMSHLNVSEHRYEGVIQMGIAGSFREKFRVGDVVRVVSEVFGDAGAEERDGSSVDLFELNLWEVNEGPFDNKVLHESESFPYPDPVGISHAHGLTVGMGSGAAETIAFRKKKFAADIESMEGAALYYVCLQMGVPCRQIRCVSNPITPRDTEQWEIKLAIDNLNHFMIKWLLND